MSTILLPPSEGKAPGGTGLPWTPGSMAVDLDREREQVIAALGRVMRRGEADRSALLHVKGKALAAATAANRGVAGASTLPAIERYTGVLYEALDYPSLPAAQRKRIHRDVLIFSGLWGVVAPTDPIPDYKLKMGASLPGLGKLASWWREPLSEALTERAGRGPVWNLLPNEHAAAWQGPEGLTQYAAVFLEPKDDGSLGAVSHWNKFLKGALVRFLAANPKATPKDLRAWKHPSGYHYDPKRDVERRDGVTVLSFVKRSSP